MICYHAVQLQTFEESTSLIQAGGFVKLMWIHNGLKMRIWFGVSFSYSYLCCLGSLVRCWYWQGLHRTK